MAVALASTGAESAAMEDMTEKGKSNFLNCTFIQYNAASGFLRRCPPVARLDRFPDRGNYLPCIHAHS
jgi:hypothetical protein